MTLYQEFETDISFRYLEKIVAILERPICIIGGWAVYFTVNEHFKKEHGRNYLGSKDIDLGFYIDKNLDKEELKNTDFGRSMALLEGLGFQPLGFRFYKDINVDTGEDLTPEQLRNTTMNPVSRGIKRVNLADAAEADWLFTVLMGEEVEPRRKFIQAHAKEVLNLDV